MQNNKSKQIIPKIILLSLVILLVVAWFQRYAIYDSWRLRGYLAPSPIAQLATDTTMNPDTRRLFYVYRPELNDKANFNAKCTDSEQTIVLGCYISQRGIYLYDVTDDRLRGIEEVTAAHETLHAAYERLSSRERTRVDRLTAQVASQLVDERIKSTIENYRKKDPSVVPNELHSILGTEVKDLPAELEEYYRQYFTDRQKVVAYSNAYESEFTDRQTQSVVYLARLDTLKKQVESLNNKLKNSAAQLNAQYSALVQGRNTAQPQAYNARVDQYNTDVNGYNEQVRYTGTLIDEYNQTLRKYNALALEQNELLKAIDSRPATIESQ